MSDDLLPPDPFEDDDDDENFQLPNGITEEQVEEVVSAAAAALSRMGLHAAGPIALQGVDDRLYLTLPVHIGDLAFKPKVQDPEQAKFDDSFREIRQGDTFNQAEAIRNRFKGKETAVEEDSATTEQTPEDE